MADRKFKHLSDKLIDETKNFAGTDPIDSDIFRREFYSMFRIMKGQNPDGITDFDIEHLNSSASSSTWQKQAVTLIVHYQTLYKRYKDMMDHEKSILRVEAKAHRQAVFYRFLTTLAIGFGVMLIYFLADSWGIKLPLIRF